MTFALALPLHAAEPDWLTDLPQALIQAKKENKLVLLDFTGSDYCAPCLALAKNVFSKDDFLNYAKTNLVLVQVDFPITKKQSEELQKANEALQDKFKVEGYPTIILLDADGKEIYRNAELYDISLKNFLKPLQKFRK